MSVKTEAHGHGQVQQGEARTGKRGVLGIEGRERALVERQRRSVVKPEIVWMLGDQAIDGIDVRVEIGQGLPNTHPTGIGDRLRQVFRLDAVERQAARPDSVARVIGIEVEKTAVGWQLGEYALKGGKRQSS